MAEGVVATFHENFTSSKERDNFMFYKEFMSDCAFVVEDGENTIKIPCHKYILGCCSWEFYNLFYLMKAESSDIPIADVSLQVATKFLEFVYKEMTELSMETVWDILKLAKRFGVAKLVHFCDTFLCDNVKEDNLVQIIEKSTEFDMEKLRTECITFMGRSKVDYFKSPLFLNISKDGLQTIIASDNLNKNEIEVFRFVNNWAENYCARNEKPPNSINKRIALGNVLMKIRFGVMTLSEFTECTNNESLLTNDQIVDIFNCIGSNGNHRSKFSSIKRKQTSETHTLFNGNFNSLNNGCSTEYFEFSVSEDTIIIGFGILGSTDVYKNQEIHILLLKDNDETIIVQNNFIVDFDGSKKINNLYLKKQITLKSSSRYTLLITQDAICNFYVLQNYIKRNASKDGVFITIHSNNHSIIAASIILR